MVYQRGVHTDGHVWTHTHTHTRMQACTHARTHGYTPANVIGENTMHCISPKCWIRQKQVMDLIPPKLKSRIDKTHWRLVLSFECIQGTLKLIIDKSINRLDSQLCWGISRIFQKVTWKINLKLFVWNTSDPDPNKLQWKVKCKQKGN